MEGKEKQADMGSAEAARGLLRWRCMGKRVLQLIRDFDDRETEDAKEAAWLTAGCAAGYSPLLYGEGVPSSAMEAYPSRDSVPPTAKQEQYAKMIQTVGVYQGLRKCTNPPHVKVDKCSGKLPEWSGQCGAEGGLVSRVSCPLEGGNYSSQGQRRAVREEGEPGVEQSTKTIDEGGNYDRGLHDARAQLPEGYIVDIANSVHASDSCNPMADEKHQRQLRLQPSCREDDGQEVRANSGTTLLQVCTEGVRGQEIEILQQSLALQRVTGPSSSNPMQDELEALKASWRRRTRRSRHGRLMRNFLKPRGGPASEPPDCGSLMERGARGARGRPGSVAASEDISYFNTPPGLGARRGGLVQVLAKVEI
eukprot:g17784.t1